MVILKFRSTLSNSNRSSSAVSNNLPAASTDLRIAWPRITDKVQRLVLNRPIAAAEIVTSVEALIDRVLNS